MCVYIYIHPQINKEKRNSKIKVGKVKKLQRRKWKRLINICCDSWGRRVGHN